MSASSVDRFFAFAPRFLLFATPLLDPFMNWSKTTSSCRRMWMLMCVCVSVCIDDDKSAQDRTHPLFLLLLLEDSVERDTFVV